MVINRNILILYYFTNWHSWIPSFMFIQICINDDIRVRYWIIIIIPYKFSRSFL